jgi:hypothetical protein
MGNLRARVFLAFFVWVGVPLFHMGGQVRAGSISIAEYYAAPPALCTFDTTLPNSLQIQPKPDLDICLEAAVDFNEFPIEVTPSKNDPARQLADALQHGGRLSKPRPIKTRPAKERLSSIALASAYPICPPIPFFSVVTYPVDDWGFGAIPPPLRPPR